MVDNFVILPETTVFCDHLLYNRFRCSVSGKDDDGIGCSTDDINMLRQRFNNLYEGLRSASMRRDTALNLSRSTLQKDSLSSVQQNVQSMQTHIGLQNVYQRLLLRCGWGCTIQVQNLQPHGFEVELFIEKGAQDENPVG